MGVRIALTAAQRLRLVLALGVVNLVLAAVALSVGIGGLATPSPVAQGPTPGTEAAPTGIPAPSVPPNPTTSSDPGPTAPSNPQPSTEPTPAESPIPSDLPIPSAEPSPSQVVPEPVVRPVVVAAFRPDRPVTPTPIPTTNPDTAPNTPTTPDEPDEPDEPATCDTSHPRGGHDATARGKAKGGGSGPHACPPGEPDHAGPHDKPPKGEKPPKHPKPPKPPKAQHDKPHDHPPPERKEHKPHKQHKPHHESHSTKQR